MPPSPRADLISYRPLIVFMRDRCQRNPEYRTQGRLWAMARRADEKTRRRRKRPPLHENNVVVRRGERGGGAIVTAQVGYGTKSPSVGGPHLWFSPPFRDGPSRGFEKNSSPAATAPSIMTRALTNDPQPWY